MGISELPVGFYKVRQRRDAYMSRRKGGFSFGSIHIMEIRRQGKTKTVSIDNGPEYPIHEFMEKESEEYEVINQIKEFSVIYKQRITLSWVDEKGDEFKLYATDAWGLRNLFSRFRFLAKPFLYVTRRELERWEPGKH
jgi:hypothetical protein